MKGYGMGNINLGMSWICLFFCSKGLILQKMISMPKNDSKNRACGKKKLNGINITDA